MAQSQKLASNTPFKSWGMHLYWESHWKCPLVWTLGKQRPKQQALQVWFCSGPSQRKSRGTRKSQGENGNTTDTLEACLHFKAALDNAGRELKAQKLFLLKILPK